MGKDFMMGTMAFPMCLSRLLYYGGISMKQSLFSMATLVVLLCGAGLVVAGGGNVQPATASPAGYSLEDMAEAMAYFSTSGNDLDFYPNTPFQILYTSDTNTFTVRTGTKFFVPVLYIDDSPPILGDFPDDEDDIPAYVFGRDQLGGHDFQIIVDGKATTLGPAYAAGAHAPGLLDGGGSNFIQVGGFLTPLSKGKHTVTIQGVLDGDVILAVFGSAYTFEDTYTVIVAD
jgi:hypothetical protein